MTLNLWLIEARWGDQGGYRPSLWVRCPTSWLVIWFGGRPDVMWLAR
jgi:hypothetical protein